MSVSKNSDRFATVLSFRASETVNNRRHFEGVFRYAREHGWHMHAFEYHRSELDPLCWRDPESGAQTGLEELLDFWKPDGCVVDCGSIERPLPRAAFGRIPVVYLDLYSGSAHSMAAGISSDDKRIAEAAARELFKFDFPDYAFVPAQSDYPWSLARKKEFVRLILRNQCAVHVFDGGDTENFQMSEWRGKLLQWLTELPKPCGLFAANDFIGKNVLDLCRMAKIGVPSDIAVVGVDDDPQICENTVPTLTSIRQDYENGGYSACAMLDRIMSKPKKKPQKLLYGIACVTRRASSCMCRDGRVQKAIEFIRRHACERIGLDDVVREMGCSRRLATHVFRLSQGNSILDSIHDERLKLVKMLLSNPRHDMKSLPDFCGYKSLVDLRRVFRARTGETIGEFMRRMKCD